MHIIFYFIAHSFEIREEINLAVSLNSKQTYAHTSTSKTNKQIMTTVYITHIRV